MSYVITPATLHKPTITRYLNAKDSHGITNFSKIIEHGNVALVKAALKYGAKPISIPKYQKRNIAEISKGLELASTLHRDDVISSMSAAASAFVAPKKAGARVRKASSVPHISSKSGKTKN